MYLVTARHISIRISYLCFINHSYFVFMTVWFEPTCLMKAEKPFLSDAWHNITYISPNIKELRSIDSTLMKQQQEQSRNLSGNEDTDKDRSLDSVITECLTLCKPLLKHIHCVIVTLGKHGALVCRDTTADTPFPTAHFSSHAPTRQHSLVSARHFPASAPGGHVQNGNVTGAGDR